MDMIDNANVAKIRYFKVERIEHGSDKNFSEAMVFAGHRQLCPIAVSMEFEDASGNPIPVTKEFIDFNLQFVDYSTGKGGKFDIFAVGNGYLWDEDVLKEVQALHADVKSIADRMLKTQPDGAGSVTFDDLFPIGPYNGADLNGEQGVDEFIDSYTLKGHRWRREFIERAVSYERANCGRVGKGNYVTAPGIPFAEARLIIKEYKIANPERPIVPADIELGLLVTREVDGFNVNYIQREDRLYDESDLRFAIETLIANDAPRSDGKEPLTRQRIVYYLSCKTLERFTVAAEFYLPGRTVSTVHPLNQNDNGLGNGREEFNSGVAIIPVKAYQPSPGHPGFYNTDPNNPGRLLRYESTKETPPGFAFYEQYIELWLGYRHFYWSSWIDNGEVAYKTDPDIPWSNCLSVHRGREKGAWSESIPDHYGWMHRETKEVLGSMAEYVRSVAYDMTHYAEGRVLLGLMTWRGRARGCILLPRGAEPIGDEPVKFVHYVDLYGTAHGFLCSIDRSLEYVEVSRYLS